MLALGIALRIPGEAVTDDADRDAILRVQQLNIPVAVMGLRARRFELEELAAKLGIVAPIVDIGERFDAMAFCNIATALGVAPAPFFVVVDARFEETAVREAGAIPLRIGGASRQTIRDAVLLLSEPIARAALMIRALVADIGIDG